MRTVNQFFIINRILPLEPETLATEALMSVAPSSSRLKIYDKLIKGFKQATGLTLGVNNLSTQLDVFCIRAAHDQQSGLLNWVGDTLHSTAVNTPGFTANRGFNTNGSSYINTGINGASSYPNWQRDDNLCVSAYLEIDHSLAVNRALIGSRAGNRYDIFTISNSSTEFQFDNNQEGASPASDSFTVINDLSFAAMQRYQSNEYHTRRNNNSNIVTRATTGVTNQPFYELCYSVAGGNPSLFCTPEMISTVTIIGRSGVDLLHLYNEIQKYIDAL